ncbi:MAG: hypothetical protein LBR80_16075 [Deltaproteobacteria bacterium]|nr:hypothetical protein [Deltaproteobacteria bacterium]
MNARVVTAMPRDDKSLSGRIIKEKERKAEKGRPREEDRDEEGRERKDERGKTREEGCQIFPPDRQA